MSFLYISVGKISPFAAYSLIRVPSFGGFLDMERDAEVNQEHRQEFIYLIWLWVILESGGPGERDFWTALINLLPLQPGPQGGGSVQLFMIYSDL